MDNAVDTGTILEDVASGDAASLVGGWMKASWGMLSVEKILWTVLLLAVCLVLVRLMMGLVRRLLERSKLDQRIRKYLFSGIKTVLYLIGAIIVVGSLGIDMTSLVALLSVASLGVTLAAEDVLGNIAGDRAVLSGCEPEQNGTRRKEGYVFVRTKDFPDGEILYWEGGAIASGMYLKKENVSVSAQGYAFPQAYVVRSLAPGIGEENYRWEEFATIRPVSELDAYNRKQDAEIAELKKQLKNRNSSDRSAHSPR